MLKQSTYLYFLKAVTETAKWTTNKIHAIKELISSTCLHVQKNAPQVYKRELIDLLFNQPYIRIGNIVEHDIAGRETASKYLKILCDIGVLEEMKLGREKVFINHIFLNLLREG